MPSIVPKPARLRLQKFVCVRNGKCNQWHSLNGENSSQFYPRFPQAIFSERPKTVLVRDYYKYGRYALHLG